MKSFDILEEKILSERETGARKEFEWRSEKVSTLKHIEGENEKNTARREVK